MPANNGERPKLDLVDVRYRNGIVDRGIKPSARRWTLDDPAYPPNYAWDVVDWQPSK